MTMNRAPAVCGELLLRTKCGAAVVGLTVMEKVLVNDRPAVSVTLTSTPKLVCVVVWKTVFVTSVPPDKGIAISEEQHLLCPGALEKNINKTHRGSGLSGAGRHDQEGAPLSGFKSLCHAPNRLVLVGAFTGVFIDRRIFERGLVLAYEAHADGLTPDALVHRVMQHIRAPEKPLESHVRVAAGS